MSRYLKRPMLYWLRELGFVDTFRMRKEVDGIDVPYYLYRLVRSGQAHTFYIQAK
jgi:hypothetical protein